MGSKGSRKLCLHIIYAHEVKTFLSAYYSFINTNSSVENDVTWLQVSAGTFYKCNVMIYTCIGFNNPNTKEKNYLRFCMNAYHSYSLEDCVRIEVISFANIVLWTLAHRKRMGERTNRNSFCIKQ